MLAARGANQFPFPRDVDQTSTVLRQVHDVIDNIARIWPTVPGIPAAMARRLGAARDQRRG